MDVHIPALLTKSAKEGFGFFIFTSNCKKEEEIRQRALCKREPAVGYSLHHEHICQCFLWLLSRLMASQSVFLYDYIGALFCSFLQCSFMLKSTCMVPAHLLQTRACLSFPGLGEREELFKLLRLYLVKSTSISLTNVSLQLLISFSSSK